jgi:CDP-L-myo-inositol myo-inositolphosphotransferase
MRTLIIAAGEGKRLGRCGSPKPLTLLNGKTILEIILEKCRSVGLHDFVIVTGYKGEEIRKFLKNETNHIEFVDNPKFTLGNGYSVYCAKKYLKNEEKFLLLMADHIFHPNLLYKIIKGDVKEGCALCVDRNLHSIFDLREATKVIEEDGKIKKIGKYLKEFNAVDTGFFLCTAEIFDALKHALEKERDELSDGMKLLIRNGKLFSIDVTGDFWLDIDTKRDLEYVIKHEIWKK